MEQFTDDEEIQLIPIKKKPKTQEINKKNINIQRQQSLQKPISKSNPKRMDLKIQTSLLDSLKFTENIQPDIIKCCLDNDFTLWEHQNFVFKLSQKYLNQKVEQDQKIIQYFNDFNQKWKIYPYQHFVDLKPETDHVIKRQPLFDQKKKNKKNKRKNQIKVIPLYQNQKIVDIRIKLEFQ
ncbi:unnamed protein product [Paramecium sonneborni]|uniref:Uncharacterized protein n=1 Tax=Paramecium sonneborni TaxID=65129 RepID=A0A8S1Q4N5_9CILI|nr:unnamed protein product [Paramecium sonneborni]